jgi:hypothetical protein
LSFFELPDPFIQASSPIRTDTRTPLVTDAQHHLLETVVLVVDTSHDTSNDDALSLCVVGWCRGDVEERRGGVSATERSEGGVGGCG